MTQQQLTWQVRRQGGYRRTGALRLDWEVDLSSISDDYLFEDASAVELWHLWVPRAAELHGDLVPIMWFVATEVPGEHPSSYIAPFQAWDAERGGPLPADFLTHFTCPTAVDSGRPLSNWLALPVVEKRWSAEQADKGGFISEALGGWTPSPLQPSLSVNALGRAAGLSPA